MLDEKDLFTRHIAVFLRSLAGIVRWSHAIGISFARVSLF